LAKRPEWLKMKAPDEKILENMENMLRDLSLHTVCESAICPNMGKCFRNKTATFMVMGDICTRNCRFCAVEKGRPSPLDPEEPKNVAIASRKLGLKHTVITSVTRDDLEDGGADHFVKIIREIRKENPQSTIELLIPDLRGNWGVLKKIIDAKPDILNHNVETVEALYDKVKPMGNYKRSIELLKQVKAFNENVYTKSGIMVGLGETKEQVIRVMEDLLEVDCDILTIGQYLRPSKKHLPVFEYVSPGMFEEYRKTALGKGFKFAASGPYVRSSYKAYDGMKTLLEINS